jgi:hypothetical protein
VHEIVLAFRSARFLMVADRRSSTAEQLVRNSVAYFRRWQGFNDRRNAVGEVEKTIAHFLRCHRRSASARMTDHPIGGL